jgi:hypothetical protein
VMDATVLAAILLALGHAIGVAALVLEARR